MPASGERGEGWFTALYTAYHPDVVRYALRRLSDMDAAMDLAQEVFVVAWRRRGEVPDRGLPWLYGVARRLLANQWRARRAAPAVARLAAGDEPSGPGPGQRPDGAAERLEDVRAAMAAMSDGDQEILRLIGWEELTLAEAAVVLGCRRATAAVRLHRARRRLARLLHPVSTGTPTSVSIQQ